MIKNRVSRIALPFVVFLMVLSPLVMFSIIYSSLVFDGTEQPLYQVLHQVIDLSIIPISTFHLWFLYYLSMIYAVSVVVALLLKKLPAVTRRISQAFNWVIERPILRVLIFAALISVVYFIMRAWYVEKFNSFI